MPESMRPERHVARIQFDRASGEWLVSNSDLTGKSGVNKKQLVSEVAAELQRRWRARGELGQLVVHTKQGDIEFERTYGQDPESRPS